GGCRRDEIDSIDIAACHAATAQGQDRQRRDCDCGKGAERPCQRGRAEAGHQTTRELLKKRAERLHRCAPQIGPKHPRGARTRGPRADGAMAAAMLGGASPGFKITAVGASALSLAAWPFCHGTENAAAARLQVAESSPSVAAPRRGLAPGPG